MDNQNSPMTENSSFNHLADNKADLAGIDRLAPKLEQLEQTISKTVLGQKEVVLHVLTTLLSGGHALLVGAPGLGKTLLVNSCAKVIGLDYSRIQFTPDLMPSDITGAEILEEDERGKRHFRFELGPVFGQLVLADEINRASPRTQSALLQAMAERIVTQGGKTWPLPRPFHVLATQNPIEQEGTYPLPEAQLDRFTMCIPLDFPPREAERQMLLDTTGLEQNELPCLLSAAELREAQSYVRALPVGEKLVDAILNLIRSLRPSDVSAPQGLSQIIQYGPGPRAAQALMLAIRARALLDGRLAPDLDDLTALSVPVLGHRLGLTLGAQADNVTIENIISVHIARYL